MDNQRALDLLEQVVAEKGDGYVYERGPKRDCLYATYDEDGVAVAPSCIVGHWAVAAGASLADLSPYEGRAADATVPLLGLGVAPVSAISTALQRAQTAQDAGFTWGEALVAAKEVLS